MDAGADDFVTKPVDPDQLRARLRVAERVLALQNEVRQLSGLLPICSYCRQIRDQSGAWQPLERYLAERTETTFSHGVCPVCLETKVKGEIEQWRRARQP
jgi:hypothetical protein